MTKKTPEIRITRLCPYKMSKKKWGGVEHLSRVHTLVIVIHPKLDTLITYYLAFFTRESISKLWSFIKFLVLNSVAYCDF